MRIRDAVPTDIERLARINAAGEPGVGPATAETLARLVAASRMTLVAEDESGPIGFILVMLEGLDYASPNYRWISERYPSFAYCDRIAIDPGARGRGVGEALYAAAFARLAGERAELVCEVNLAPPNPGSLRFHARLGFQPIGERWDGDGAKGVVFLARSLLSAR